MKFAAPHLLWLLWIIPLLAFFLWQAWRRKQYLISQFVQSRLLNSLTIGVSKTRQKIRLAMLVLSVGLLCLCLARPEWGFGWEEAKERGLDIVVAIDTSRSMLANDVTPNRLERAKLAALDLKSLAPSDRLGLIAFAGTAFLQSPLSLDEQAFRQSVQALNVSIMPQGGTALAEAVQTALEAFKKDNDNYKVLVLFSDGEDHDSGAVEAARAAAKEGLRIFTVGVGTPAGELLRAKDDQGNVSFIKDSEGNVVKSRLNEPLLRQLGEITGGFYIPLSGAHTMEELYKRGLAPLPKTEYTARLVKHYHERFQWFLAPAILLLIAEVFLPERKRAARPAGPARARAFGSAGSTAALVFLFLTPAVHASVRDAARDYRKGQYDRALHEYERLLEKNEADPRLHFNAGASAFQAGKFDEAEEHLQAALKSPDLKLQQQTYYNLGNAYYRQGEDVTDFNQKMSAWQNAAEQYKHSLALDPQDGDAKYNLEFVRKKLKELQEQQKQQQQNQKRQNQDKKDQQKQQDQQNKSDQKNQDQQKQEQKNQQQNQPQNQKNQEQKQPSPSEQEKKQQQQSQPKPGEKKEAQKPGANPDQDKKNPPQPGQQEKKNQTPEQASQSMAGAAVAMTPEQAKRLLNTQKNEEKPLLFIPPEATHPPKNRSGTFKDW